MGGRVTEKRVIATTTMHSPPHSFVCTSALTSPRTGFFSLLPSLSLSAPPPCPPPSLSLPPSSPLSFSPSHSLTVFHTCSTHPLLPLPSLSLLQRIHPGLCHLSASDATTSYSSPVDSGSSDDLCSHVQENRPKDNDVDVPLGTTVTVVFDKDVRTVNINKLFEVSQTNISVSLT